jgi:hypothetical protein
MSVRRCAIRGVIAVALVAGVAESARAQDRLRVEVSGGYQILKLLSEPLDAAGVGTFFPVGWFFEMAAPVSSGLTLVGQLGGHYRSESAPVMLMDAPGADDHSLKVHSYLAGARVVGRREDGLTAFFHLLAGTTRVGLTQSATAPVPGILLPLLGVDGATTDFTLQAGGGFDFPLTSRWAGRVTADYLRLSTEGAPTHGVRVAVGWVVPLR